jgi:DNA-binding transcriptional regulator YdaS (Cro superfamily)
MWPERRPKDAGLAKAIKAAGSSNALARLVGVDPSAVSRWKRVPFEHVITIERVTGVPREELRPELYQRKK